MSTYNWSTMSSHERDALVMRKVMGRTMSMIGLSEHVPHYTTDIAAAWQVMEKMRGNKWDMHLSVNLHDKWETWLYHQPTRNESLAHAPTAPEAICLAAID